MIYDDIEADRFNARNQVRMLQETICKLVDERGELAAQLKETQAALTSSSVSADVLQGQRDRAEKTLAVRNADFLTVVKERDAAREERDRARAELRAMQRRCTSLAEQLEAACVELAPYRGTPCQLRAMTAHANELETQLRELVKERDAAKARSKELKEMNRYLNRRIETITLISTGGDQ